MRFVSALVLAACCCVAVPAFADKPNQLAPTPTATKSETVASLKTLIKLHEERASEWDRIAKYDGDVDEPRPTRRRC